MIRLAGHPSVNEYALKWVKGSLIGHEHCSSCIINRGEDDWHSCNLGLSFSFHLGLVANFQDCTSVLLKRQVKFVRLLDHIYLMSLVAGKRWW